MMVFLVGVLFPTTCGVVIRDGLRCGVLTGLCVVELYGEILFLGPAALPAISPVQDKKLKAEGINLHARLEADAQVTIIHLVLFGARVE